VALPFKIEKTFRILQEKYGTAFYRLKNVSLNGKQHNHEQDRQAGF
jgi:hypothetical protein